MQTNIDKTARVLPSGVRVAGGIDRSTSASKQKHRPKIATARATRKVTADTIVFEGVNGAKCRKWWQENVADHEVKKNLQRAGVHWAIQMLVFPIKKFEVPLQMMVGVFDANSRTRTFDYGNHRLRVSFVAADFTRVFGIPGRNGKKVELKAKKMNKDMKEHWVKIVSRNLTPVELAFVTNATKNRGMKKSFVAERPWHGIMHVVKSRLTGSSRASDIALPQIILMNGLMNGVQYDWATVLADRMYEFMTLHQRTFYMSHYAIGLFLEAMRSQQPEDEVDIKSVGSLAPEEPPILYWRHMDVGLTPTARQKRRRQDVSESNDFDSRWEETSEASSDSDGDSGASLVEAVPASTPPTPSLVRHTHADRLSAFESVYGWHCVHSDLRGAEAAGSNGATIKDRGREDKDSSIRRSG